VLKFSGEILVLILSLTVAGLNFFMLGGQNYQDNSLASSFLANHVSYNPKLFAKNNSIAEVVAPANIFFQAAQADDFTGLSSQGLNNNDTSPVDPSNNIIIGNQDTILAPNPDSIQSLIQKQIKIYQTQTGDTLKSISAQFGITQQTIMWANKLATPDIKPAWQLIILPVDGVLVQAGPNDTLPDIAHKYNPEKYNNDATVRENSADQLLQTIISYNALEGPEDINEGDLIIVPGGQLVLPPAPKPTPKLPKGKTPGPDTSLNTVTSLGSGYDGVNHLFPRGYCTYYVANKWLDGGTKITFGGNAKSWLANARASGYVTGQEPATRAAVVMTGPKGVLRRYGHVAYVESVNGDGTITVSEMNYVHFNRIDTRTISIHDSAIKGYIYP